MKDLPSDAVRLPTNIKPSVLILSGIEDLEAIELLSEKYLIDFCKWHQPDPKLNICRICMAGAIMANRYKVPPDKRYVGSILEGFSKEETRYLTAIDEFRLGLVRLGLEVMGIKSPKSSWNVTITPYEENRDKFILDMKQMAADLHEVGL